MRSVMLRSRILPEQQASVDVRWLLVICAVLAGHTWALPNSLVVDTAWSASGFRLQISNLVPDASLIPQGIAVPGWRKANISVGFITYFSPNGFQNASVTIVFSINTTWSLEFLAGNIDGQFTSFATADSDNAPVVAAIAGAAAAGQNWMSYTVRVSQLIPTCPKFFQVMVPSAASNDGATGLGLHISAVQLLASGLPACAANACSQHDYQAQCILPASQALPGNFSSLSNSYGTASSPGSLQVDDNAADKDFLQGSSNNIFCDTSLGNVLGDAFRFARNSSQAGWLLYYIPSGITAFTLTTFRLQDATATATAANASLSVVPASGAGPCSQFPVSLNTVQGPAPATAGSSWLRELLAVNFTSLTACLPQYINISLSGGSSGRELQLGDIQIWGYGPHVASTASLNYSTPVESQGASSRSSSNIWVPVAIVASLVMFFVGGALLLTRSVRASKLKWHRGSHKRGTDRNVESPHSREKRLSMPPTAAGLLPVLPWYKLGRHGRPPPIMEVDETLLGVDPEQAGLPTILIVCSSISGNSSTGSKVHHVQETTVRQAKLQRDADAALADGTGSMTSTFPSTFPYLTHKPDTLEGLPPASLMGLPHDVEQPGATAMLLDSNPATITITSPIPPNWKFKGIVDEGMRRSWHSKRSRRSSLMPPAPRLQRALSLDSSKDQVLPETPTLRLGASLQLPIQHATAGPPSFAKKYPVSTGSSSSIGATFAAAAALAAHSPASTQLTFMQRAVLPGQRMGQQVLELQKKFLETKTYVVGAVHHRNSNSSRQPLEDGDSKYAAAAATSDGLQLHRKVGHGGFGAVWAGTWEGAPVAVKVMVFSASMDQESKLERMATIEMAISNIVTHPNICHAYTCQIRQLAKDPSKAAALEHDKAGSPDAQATPPPAAASGSSTHAAAAGPSSTLAGGRSAQPAASWMDWTDFSNAEVSKQFYDTSSHTTWELRLIMEFCDMGSLRDLLRSKRQAIKQQQAPTMRAFAGQQQLRCSSASSWMGAAGKTMNAFVRQSSSGSEHSELPDLEFVLLTALDVARGMRQLHQHNIIHGDLKSHNVLLKSTSSDPRRFVAKVADFGLAVRMEGEQSFVSGVYHGTLGYMSPETRMHSKIFPASDVFSFGMLMWELFTCRCVLDDKGLKHASPQQEQWRPSFPSHALTSYVSLARRCWDANPFARPCFEEVSSELTEMLHEHYKMMNAVAHAANDREIEMQSYLLTYGS